MTEPTPVTATEPTTARARFRRTLIQVMSVQIIALALLWWLQSSFTH